MSFRPKWMPKTFSVTLLSTMLPTPAMPKSWRFWSKKDATLKHKMTTARQHYTWDQYCKLFSMTNGSDVYYVRIFCASKGRAGQGAWQLTVDEGSYLPNCKTNLVIPFVHSLSLSIVLALHKHNRLPLGQILAFIFFYILKSSIAELT